MNVKGVSLICFKLFAFLSLFVNASLAQSYYPAGLAKSKINLWFDANDASTITQSAGSITTWLDKANSLQAVSPAAANNPNTNNTLLAGKNVVEFNGTKVLNIADNPLLDPNNGFHLAQVVYVYPDASTSYKTATDFRVGTYSRNENPSKIGTPSIGVRYVTADLRYRLALQRNSSSAVLGIGDNTFPDLSGTWNLFENYLTWTGPTDSAIVIQRNANNQLSNPYAFANSTQSVAIGNRFTNNVSVHWSIGETILVGKALNKTSKNILDVYLAYKWGLQANLPSSVANLYNSPASNYNNNIVGIGTEGGTDSIAATGSNNGLGFQNVSGINGFLRENVDYIFAGDNNKTGTVNAGTGYTRWGRIWFLDKTDSLGFGGRLNLFFDFDAYGTPSLLDTANNKYYILYNPSDSNFSSGNNYVIPFTSYQQWSGTKQLAFLVDASNLSNGYYTVVYGGKNLPVTNIINYSAFVYPAITVLPAPGISKIYTGNTFNYLTWTNGGINYQIAYYKIYVSVNNGAFTALDSVYNGSNYYAHYNLTNGTSYKYRIRAVYAVGKESVASDTVSTVPGLYAPTWLTLPQYASSGKVYMKAQIPIPNTPLKFYFDCVAGGGKASNYQVSTNYTDVNLLTGTTYTYRYKLMDSTKGVSTESAWSPSVSVNLIDSAKGGFAYKFSFADNNSFIIPNGTGPTDYVPTSIDTSGLRFIRHAPAPYVHPRIYCNPEDSTDIRWRLKNTNSGRAVAKYIHALTTLLQLGSSGTGSYSRTANYAKDTLGNPLLSNVGYSNEKPRYDSLSGGDIGVVQNIASGFGGYANQLANVLAYEAFECWLYKGKIDSTTMTSYTTRADKLAKAVSLWAKKALTVNNPQVSFANRDKFGSLQIAFIYDFLYDQMTTTQRDTVRMFIAAMQPTDSTQLHLYNTPSYATVTNWSTFGWEIWNILAIEGETGYTQKDENTLQNYCRTVLNFLNYGFYSQTGGPVEGIGKNQMNAPMLVALAKRGYSLLGHPAVRAFATKYYPAIMQPFGYSMLGTDLLGGTGTLNDFVNNTYVSAAYGGWKHATSLDPIGLKWAFPNDTTIDFVWKNYMQKEKAGGATYNYTYRYQDFLGDSKGHAGYWNFLHAAIFASDYSSTPLQTLAQKVYTNNLMYFDSLGGFATLRSGYDTLSSALFFHCRTDLGGHTYGNKNDIVYSGLGRLWIPRVTSNANSDAPEASGTGVASSILINNIGQSVDTTVAQNLDILPSPGKILKYHNSPTVQMIAGDATEAYGYQWSYLFGGYTGDNPLLTSGWTKVFKTLNSYRYSKYYSFDDIPLYNKLTQGDYSWNAGARYYRSVAKPWLNGVINKAYRTVAMVTDTKPYVLVTDDVQKDGTVNNYKWVAQLANDLTIDSIVVNNSTTNYRNDIIFKEPTATGNRRFLVRVLNNNGAVDANVPVYVDSIVNPISSITPNNKLPRIVIESNSIDPQYKVLLYAYRQGEALPNTTWNNDRSRLLITTTASINTILFPIDSIGRTNIQILSGNLLPLTINVNASLRSSVAEITWQAYEQQDVANYVVEKSVDGVSFTSLFVAKPTTAINDTYATADLNLADGANYYRIKVVYKNGDITYSKVCVIRVTALVSVSIVPNPVVSNQISLKTKGLKSGKYLLKLIDNAGRTIASKTIAITSSNSALQWPLDINLTNGSYYLILQNTSGETIASSNLSKL